MAGLSSGISYRGKSLEDFTRDELIAYIVMNKAKPFAIKDEQTPLDDLVKMSKIVGETGWLAPLST